MSNGPFIVTKAQLRAIALDDYPSLAIAEIRTQELSTIINRVLDDFATWDNSKWNKFRIKKYKEYLKRGRK